MPAFNDPISYISLFPDTEFNNITEAYSLYGAGAYFVYLMNTITDEKKIKPVDESLALLKRRPDLEYLQLNAANTDTELPYLQGVVNIALNRLLPQELKYWDIWQPVPLGARDNNNFIPYEIWEAIATGKNAFIPFNYPVASINLGLKVHGTSLNELAACFSLKGYDDPLWYYTELGLTAFDVQVIKDPSIGLDQWFEEDSKTIIPERICMVGGLDEEALLLLVYNNLDSSYTSSLEKLFINGNDPVNPLQYFPSTKNGETSRFENMSSERLQRIRVFLLLAKATGWDFNVLNNALTFLGINSLDNLEENLSKAAKLFATTNFLNYSPSALPSVGTRLHHYTAAKSAEKKNLRTNTKPNISLLSATNGNPLNIKKSNLPKEILNGSCLFDVLYISKLLNINSSLLYRYLLYSQKLKEEQKIDLETLFELTVLRNDLQGMGYSLTNYLTIYSLIPQSPELVESNYYFRQFPGWFQQLASALKNIDEGYKSTKESEKENSEQELLKFKQWTQALSDYWGLDAEIVSALFMGCTHNSGVSVNELNKIFNKEETVRSFLLSWLSYLLLSNEFKLSPDIVATAGSKWIMPGKSAILAVPFEDTFVLPILKLQFFSLSLQPESQKKFIDFIRNNTTYDKHELSVWLHELLKWDEKKLLFLLNKWHRNKNINSWICFNILGKLRECFQISGDTGKSVQDLFELLDTVTKRNYQQISGISEQYDRWLITKSDADNQFSTAWNKSKEELLERVRDALIPIVHMDLNKEYDDVNNSNLLSDYFLLDVSASGVLMISPVREGINAVQAYLMRCKNNIEKVTSGIPKEGWLWLLNYRLWQAEQKLENYPQNYFRADNRTDATNLFSDFKAQLQQHDLTADSAKDSFQQYVNNWLRLTDKTIVDTFYYKREKDGKNLICFVGKSNIESQQFYYQEAELSGNEIGKYSQWHEIDINIPAEKVSMIYTFNRYFIFWSTLSVVTNVDPTSNTNKKYKLHTATVHYSMQDASGNWLPVQEWDSFPFYLETEDKFEPNKQKKLINWKEPTDSISEDSISISYFLQPDNPCWKKPMPFIIDGNLYVWLSPVIPKGVRVSKELNGETYNYSYISEEFKSFVESIRPGEYYEYASYILFRPKIMNTSGFITESANNIIVAHVDNTYYPVQCGKNKEAIRAIYGFNFYDVYVTAMGEYVNIFDNKNGYAIINNEQPRPEEKAWNIQYSLAIRGMQGYFYATDIGSFFMIPEKIIDPMQYTMDAGTIYIDNTTFNSDILKFNLHSFGTLFPWYFSKYLLYHGLSDVFAIKHQSEPLDNEDKYDFTTYTSNKEVLIFPAITNTTQVNFYDAYGIYAQELFFYAPVLTSLYLRQNLWHEDAITWYKFVFDPFENDQEKAWHYFPFFESEKFCQYFTYKDSKDKDEKLIHYKKWTVENYLSCLIEWGDDEFRQETWESLNMADQLYMEATDLLGKKPLILDRKSGYEKMSDRSYHAIKDNTSDAFFGWPCNLNLSILWNQVADRLYKLRNGLNINGERQRPSEFGVPIDPGKLQMALTTGGINPYNSSNLSSELTVYRFRELLSPTEAVIEMVVQFGNTVYNVLQQKDHEKLQLLQATHQFNIENFVEQHFQVQITEVQAEKDALSKNLAAAKLQYDHYKSLIDTGLIAGEITNLALNGVAAALQLSGSVARGFAVAGHLAPTIFGLADGGMQPGSAIDSGASIFGEVAQSLQTSAQIAATASEYVRREEEWQLQKNIAQSTIDQLNYSVDAANARLLIAQATLQEHRLSITQNREVLEYLTTKFTNADLYNWMSTQMSSLYFQAYQLALNALHKLQVAYAYEVDDNTDFIPANSWQGLRKGLLAGEALKLALSRMSTSYLSKNIRRQEIEKILSLKELVKDKTKWESFVGDGSGKLDFQILTENLTKENDIRTLKVYSISVSIPAVIGPYQTFNAVLRNEDIGQEITISKGIDDMGFFIEELNDGRYRPFEGMKIPVSDKEPNCNWSFFLPDNDLLKNISDVILSIKFTAK